MSDLSTKQPTLRQLVFLTTLHRKLHFRKAAEACHITQAAFSLGIKELEKLLGADLVDRTNKQVVFTALGEQVVEQANAVLQETDKLIEIADCSKVPFTGRLRLGVIPTIAPFMLANVLPGIKNLWPRLQLSIREDLTAHLHQALLRGELDLLLLALPLELKGIESLVLFKDYFKLVYRQGTKIFSPPHYNEQTLPNNSILLLEDGHCLRNHAISACNVDYAHKVSSFTASSLHTLVQMVGNDLGITFVPELAIQHGILKQMPVKTLDMPKTAYREIGFAWRKGSRRVEEFHSFAETFMSLTNQRKTH